MPSHIAGEEPAACGAMHQYTQEHSQSSWEKNTSWRCIGNAFDNKVLLFYAWPKHKHIYKIHT